MKQESGNRGTGESAKQESENRGTGESEHKKRQFLLSPFLPVSVSPILLRHLRFTVSPVQVVIFLNPGIDYRSREHA